MKPWGPVFLLLAITACGDNHGGPGTVGCRDEFDSPKVLVDERDPNCPTVVPTPSPTPSPTPIPCHDGDRSGQDYDHD